MEYAFDGIADLFRFQRNLPDAEMLAKARAFISDLPPHKDDFIDYGLPSNFDTQLDAAADAFEATFANVDTAKSTHIAGTADLGSTIRSAMVLIRELDAIVKNAYTNNPGKLAAWVAASHVERPPTKPKPPATPTP
jgi:hypothetical protein